MHAGIGRARTNGASAVVVYKSSPIITFPAVPLVRPYVRVYLHEEYCV